jgi:hypothetical protein
MAGIALWRLLVDNLEHRVLLNPATRNDNVRDLEARYEHTLNVESLPVTAHFESSNSKR